MNEYKLINFKDIVQLLAKRWIYFLALVLLLLALFALLPRLPQTPRYMATAQVSLEYRKDGLLDYDTSAKLASNYGKFSIQPSLQQSLQEKLPAPDSSLSIRIAPVAYQNLIHVSASSSTAENAVLVANAMADYLLGQSPADENPREQTRYLLAFKAEDSAKILRFQFNTKDRISYIVIAVFGLAMLLIALELWRTTVKTELEASKISGYELVIDHTEKNAAGRLQTLLKHKDIQSLAVLPIGDADVNPSLEQALKTELKDTTLHYCESLLQHAAVLDTAKQCDAAVLQLNICKCDYRDLQKAAVLCRECGIHILGVLLA